MRLLKRITAWILLVVVQQYIYCCAADLKVVESYYVLKYEYNEFLSPLIYGGATEEELLVFFGDVEEELNKIDGLTKENIEGYLKDVLINVATYGEHRNLSATIIMCYQADMEEYFETEKIPPRMQGLYEAMVKAIFGEDGLDKAELAKVYETALEAYKNKNSYTEETITPLKTAIDKTLPVLKNKAATEAEIVEVKDMLETAYAGLEKKQGVSAGGGGGGGLAGETEKPKDPEETGSADNEGTVNVPESMFIDLTQKHWSYPAVEYLAQRSILSGYEDGTFRPDVLVKREEVARILCSALDLELGTEQNSFSDVKTGAWYEKYVNCIAANGIMQGTGNGMFGVGSTLTRQDLAVIADRLVNDGRIDKDFAEMIVEGEFDDIDQAAVYARDAINRVRKIGIIAGVGNNKFAPTNGVTRSQVAQIIYNLIK